MTRFLMAATVALACFACLTANSFACDYCPVQVQQAVVQAPVVQYAAPAVQLQVQAAPVYAAPAVVQRQAFVPSYGYGASFAVQRNVVQRNVVVQRNFAAKSFAAPVVVEQSVVQRRGLFGRNVTRSRTVVR